MFSILIVILTVYNVYAQYDSTVHNVIVVLGSADNKILNERVTSTIEFINNANSPCTLYLSGGVKHSFDTEASEATKMASVFTSNAQNVQIVLDELAKNTAENFVYLKKWVYDNFSQDNLPNVVISTSDFHKNRAERIFKGILPELDPVWNLSKSHCKYCWNDENIHMKNVDSDIKKAIKIL
jgi:uncharacterized SAM-binding protein YcdF (DUF218 family)